MEGANHEGYLLTLVECKCGHLLMHLPGISKVDEVTATFIVEIWLFVGNIRSLKMYDGKKFRGHETISLNLWTRVYFSHQYAPCGRGTNENTNGLIRQFQPQEMSFKNLEKALCNQADRDKTQRSSL